mmetsp:Transcript_39910/g.109827  ORF Transcript_39910/g.109827 Transcript_39910/m.109827 type:complete len:375 (+) Transcript_39910:89-1213(+)
MELMQTTALRAIPDDSLIESSFRRLLASIESEKENIRNAWQQIEQERVYTTAEIMFQRKKTDDWVASEKQKIDCEWNRLNKLHENLAAFFPEESKEVVEINCISGGVKKVFTLPRSMLTSIEGSELARIFSDAFLPNLERDEYGRFLFDFNPECFAIVVEYLQNRRLRHDAPIPIIPKEQQQNMEFLVQRLKLWPFIQKNGINPVHSTSLQVDKNVLTATHPGWQIVAAQYPLTMCGVSYFEMKVLVNPDPKGCLAVGLCNHVPQGPEVHSIGLANSILYISNNGLRSDIIVSEDVSVHAPAMLVAGTTFGIRHDAATRSAAWFFGRQMLGITHIRPDAYGDSMRSLYPVFAMYYPEQSIQVDFDLSSPDVPGE